MLEARYCECGHGYQRGWEAEGWSTKWCSITFEGGNNFWVVKFQVTYVCMYVVMVLFQVRADVTMQDGGRYVHAKTVHTGAYKT